MTRSSDPLKACLPNYLMKLLKRPIAIIFSLLLVLSVAGAGFASEADQRLAAADKAAAASATATKSTDKKENYDKALRIYTEVQKKYSGSPEGAQALYRMAELKSKRQPGQKDKQYFQTLYQAHENLKTLVNNYDRPASELKAQGLSESEIGEIQKSVADAKTRDAEIRTTLDKHNKSAGFSAILYRMMDFLVNLTGKIPSFSYWFAIVILTVIIKAITTPLTKAQFKAMKEMQAIAPKIKELQEKYKGDQKVIGEKTMELYKEHNINPFASCLPILIQMPILMILWYTMKAYEFQFLQAKFLWIGSGLSHVASLPIPSFFGSAGGKVWIAAANLAEPDFILLVLYLISMYISTKMSAVDPSQAEQQKMMAIMMPLMFGLIFATFPSAFLLYWLLLNILQTTQQYFILRAPMPALAPSAPAAPSDAPSTDGDGRVNRRRRRR